MVPGAKKECPFCGSELALGAVACFRCGRLLVGDAAGGTGTGGTGGTDQALHPTRLGTNTRASLIEERWLLKAPVGMAPNATLWLAQDTTLDRPVTVKLLNEELAGDAGIVARFEQEARQLARIDHKNIALALATGRAGAVPFLVLKQLRGRPLAEVLHASGGRLDTPAAAAIGAELCEAVEALEAEGIALHDLQPRQVHLEETGDVVLIDLGDAAAPSGYRAPGPERGARAAVWSIGCLVYEMVTGRPAFEGGSAALRPPGLDAVVRRALSADAAARPGLAQLREALVAFAPPRGAPLIPAMRGQHGGPNTEPNTMPAAVMPGAPRHALTGRAPDVTPAAPREAVTAPAPAAAREQTVSMPALRDEPTTVAPQPKEQSTRALPAAALKLPERERVTAPRPFHRQPSGRRAIALASLAAVLAVVSATVIALDAAQVEPPPPTPLPLEQRKVVTPEAPKKPELSIDDVLPAAPAELEHRREQVKIVDPGRETAALSRPKLRGGPAVAPWKVNRRGRRPSTTSSPAAVVLVALFKGRPVGAHVEIDGVCRGITPLELNLAPGDHALKLDYPGGVLTEVMLGFLRGEAVRLEIELRTREQAAMRSNPPLKGAKPE